MESRAWVDFCLYVHDSPHLHVRSREYFESQQTLYVTEDQDRYRYIHVRTYTYIHRLMPMRSPAHSVVWEGWA